MKNTIMILALLISTSLFSSNFYNIDYFTGESKSNFEAGIMFGYSTSSGLFLKYNIDNFISIRANGFMFKENSNYLYNLKSSLSYTIHNSKKGEFYLITGLGMIKYIDGNYYDDEENQNQNQTDVTNIYSISVGLGYKYKFKERANFFVELEQNLFISNKSTDNLLTVPLPVMGLSVDF